MAGGGGGLQGGVEGVFRDLNALRLDASANWSKHLLDVNT